jgi:pimeloyl-ACP methyl ester carboxylesterase
MRAVLFITLFFVSSSAHAMRCADAVSKLIGEEESMKYWGIAIPGLAMNSKELPRVEGLLCLDNPEVGNSCKLAPGYGLHDIAELHIRTIESKKDELESGELHLIGMSMGGMILSIMATRFRDRLPANTKFHFLVTTPNLPGTPAVPDSLLAQWATARPGDVESFRPVIEPFFAPGFRASHPTIVDEYIAYRATGGNGQTPGAFMRQLGALRSFDGSQHFPHINPAEAVFIGGKQDLVLGPTHNQGLEQLLPGATHIEIETLGHMINLEMPEAFRIKGGKK